MRLLLSPLTCHSLDKAEEISSLDDCTNSQPYNNGGINDVGTVLAKRTVWTHLVTFSRLKLKNILANKTGKKPAITRLA
ncbi:MAG: hypothetical protein ABL868_06490, partial [Sulfuriferula sp.]